MWALRAYWRNCLCFQEIVIGKIGVAVSVFLSNRIKIPIPFTGKIVSTYIAVYSFTWKLSIASNNSRLRNSRLRTRNSRLRTRNSRLRTRNSRARTRNSRLRTRNSRARTSRCCYSTVTIVSGSQYNPIFIESIRINQFIFVSIRYKKINNSVIFMCRYNNT